MSTSKHVFIVEEVAGNCGIHEHLACELQKLNPALRIKSYDLGSRYIPHGSIDDLYDMCGLSAEKQAKSILEVLQNEK